MAHYCHANGCEAEAHPEVPFCKPHFQLLPKPHQEKLWKGRPKGKCGACNVYSGVTNDREPDWNHYLNLGLAIIACVEAPQYEPREEWLDEQGFCWKGGLHDAVKTVRVAKKVIEKFGLQAGG